MPQKRLSNEDFLSSLTTLLNSATSAASGSVFLTQKSMPVSDGAEESSQIIIRATNGAKTTKSATKSKVAKTRKPKIKFATVVDAAELEDFYTKYAEVCKKSMDALRKRDKKKAKEKAKAAKKKKGGVAG